MIKVKNHSKVLIKNQLLIKYNWKLKLIEKKVKMVVSSKNKIL